MMRVAMIDPSLFTLPYDRGLATGLAEGGHMVTLFGRRHTADDGSSDGLTLAPAFYHAAGSRAAAALPEGMRLAVKGVDHIWSMVRLVPRLRRERPDVIHFQWLALPAVDRLMLPGLRRVAPLVMTVHDTNPFNGNPSSRLQARGFFSCLAHFDRVIVHTAQGHARLRSAGVPRELLSVVPHGPLGGLAERLAPDPMTGEICFTLFGKIKPYKGSDTLISAYAALPPALRAQSRLRIIGKPYMDLAPLYALVRAHGIGERVTIEPHFVRDDDVAAVFGSSVVAVFPYREIEFSGVLVQALAYGRPIVASAIGCFAETLTDGVEGHLASPGDAAALSAALAHCIQDRRFAAACSAHALRAAHAGADWGDIGRQTSRIYEEACAPRLATGIGGRPKSAAVRGTASAEIPGIHR